MFDKADREFGTAGVVDVLSRHAHRSPDQLADRIRAAALAHGAQMDDQTLLVIRADGSAS